MHQTIEDFQPTQNELRAQEFVNLQKSFSAQRFDQEALLIHDKIVNLLAQPQVWQGFETELSPEVFLCALISNVSKREILFWDNYSC